MPDNIVLSTVPRPQQSWFSGANQQAPISQALGALENGASAYNLASLTAAPSQPAATTQDAAVQKDLSALEQPAELKQREPQQESQVVEDLDFELVVGSLLDDISSVMDDIKENRLALNDQLVDLVAHSFQDISRHIDHVPEHIAVEVGELGADICDLIESRGTSAQPIIALFNP